MKPFPEQIEEVKSQDRQLFEIISKSGWSSLKRGEIFDSNAVAESAVIGVAIWDKPTIEALAKLAAKRRNLAGSTTVFNMDDCLTEDDLKRFLPGISGVLQTPVVVEYRGGQSVRKLEGKAAREWIEGKDL